MMFAYPGPPLTEQAEDADRVWEVFLIGAVAMTLLVTGLLVYIVIRFRRRDRTLPAPAVRWAHAAVGLLGPLRTRLRGCRPGLRAACARTWRAVALAKSAAARAMPPMILDRRQELVRMTSCWVARVIAT